MAVNDTGPAVTQNTPVTFSTSTLLANDTDPNGDPLTVTGVTSGTGGTATLNTPNATVTFTPTTASRGRRTSPTRSPTGAAAPHRPASPSPSRHPAPVRSACSRPARRDDQHQRHQPGGAGREVPELDLRHGQRDQVLQGHPGYRHPYRDPVVEQRPEARHRDLRQRDGERWQTATFSSPVALTAGTTYTRPTTPTPAATRRPTTALPARSRAPLTAPSSGTASTPTAPPSAFPTQTFQNTNYWSTSSSIRAARRPTRRRRRTTTPVRR